ncbi:MAG: hypothetical protein IPP01_04950 [Saprospiraceae bacterium]|nr:hypothetical protein [Saprospiraceae bacterium]
MDKESIKMIEELEEEIYFDDEGDEPESEVIDEGPAKYIQNRVTLKLTDYINVGNVENLTFSQTFKDILFGDITKSSKLLESACLIFRFQLFT